MASHSPPCYFTLYVSSSSKLGHESRVLTVRLASFRCIYFCLFVMDGDVRVPLGIYALCVPNGEGQKRH